MGPGAGPLTRAPRARRVMQGRREFVEVTVALRTRFPLPGDDLKDGPATAMVRPQDLTIGNKDAREKGVAALSGKVRHREFLGSRIRYSVESGGQVFLVDDTHHAGRPVFADGEKVSLILDVAQVRILGG